MEAVEVTVEIPGDSRFVALTRVVAASIATEAGLSIDEIEDLRMAVDELVSLTLSSTTADAPDPIRLTYRLAGTAVEVSASVDSDVDLGERSDELTGLILSSVTDRYSLGVGGGTVVKVRGEG